MLAEGPRANVLAATAVTLVLVLAGAVRASTGDWAASGEASMRPALVTPKPHGVQARARGSFSASFWRYSEGWHSVRFRLTTSRLTGPIVAAHVHTGAPGRNGPELVTLLCARSRCHLGLVIRSSAELESWVETMMLLGAYVDVHTKRNPRGELRGQVEIRRIGS